MRQSRLFKLLLLSVVLSALVLGGCDKMKNNRTRIPIAVDSQSFYIDKDLFDILFSTFNNSGTARSIGYYINLLSPRIDLNRHHLPIDSDAYDTYCFYCQNMLLFLVFNNCGVNDYRNACLFDIYCTDVFYEFEDFSSIQIGSRVTDVKRIDNSTIYKQAHFSSGFQMTKHLCKEGVIEIEWEKKRDYVVSEISYHEDEYVQKLYEFIYQQ